MNAVKTYVPPQALTEFLNRLQSEGRDLQQHGVYVEKLADGGPLAKLNETATFNPASVIKLATTLAALETLGPKHRFRTEFRASGEINPKTGELLGNLILVSGGDPAFSIADARAVGDELRRLGVRRISGSLVVAGDFVCNENSQTDISAGVFRRQSQLGFRQPTKFESRRADFDDTKFLLAVESDSLLNIVRYQNAHSVNAMADLLATHIGGAAGVQKFLTELVAVPREAVYISHGSGLDVNRLTPQDTVRLLRRLVDRLAAYGLPPESVMSIAGIDSGTLLDRFAEEEFAGSVLAKTGTLHSTDDGVAALAGLMNTRQCGQLLFAIYDMAEGRRVLHLRQVQDDFLKRLAMECGGPLPMARRSEEDAVFRPQSRMEVSAGLSP
ncbi:MAG TPA: D-alanyl-D-alanine carboxypeptidase [Blastocatellia bacterium]|nr:D-alanyl-D-alanine carboxypeptidase [Blastocatellia bacterium]HMY70747.1 D-alanyl-D-alanine carboxypeptidase [Blastocatellia bacterium]